MPRIPEVWKPIAGLPGYEVSNLGNVRSIDRVIETARGSRFFKGQTLLPCLDCDEYMQVCFSLDNKRRNRRVHILVLEAFVGPRPEGMECCHGAGGRLDNRLENLRWDTRTNNRLEAALFDDWHTKLSLRAKRTVR